MYIVINSVNYNFSLNPFAFIIAAEELKKRWKSLKDTNAKHLRRISKHPYARKWIWADHMKFFLPYLNVNNKVSNIVDTESDNGPECDYEDATMDNNDEHNVGSTNDEFHELTIPKSEYVLSGSSYDDQNSPANDTSVIYVTERNSPQTMPQANSSAIFTITNGVAVKRSYNPCSPKPIEECESNKRLKIENENEDNESILLAYAKTIKKFSPKRQAMTKFKIAQIIMEQELLQIEEDEAKSNGGRANK